MLKIAPFYPILFTFYSFSLFVHPPKKYKADLCNGLTWIFMNFYGLPIN